LPIGSSISARAQALEEIKHVTALPSRQGLDNNFAEGCVKSDLTDLPLCPSRLVDWRRNQRVHPSRQIGSILAVEAICFKPKIVISDASIKGMDLTGLIQSDFATFTKEMTESKDAFLKLANEHWDCVIQAAFV
jgi:hypothetical protein